MSNYNIQIEDYQVDHGIRITGTVHFWSVDDNGVDVSSIELEDSELFDGKWRDSVVEISVLSQEDHYKALFLKACETFSNDIKFQDRAYEVWFDAQ